jgi:hypothetical protein
MPEFRSPPVCRPVSRIVTGLPAKRIPDDHLGPGIFGSLRAKKTQKKNQAK